MEWEWISSIDSFLTSLGTFLIGVGTIWLAYTGNAFRKDNKQFEHKFNLACEAINIFHNLRKDIQQIRSPVANKEETEKAKSWLESDPFNLKSLSAAMALLRMNERLDNLHKMNKIEAEFCTIFGETDAFNTIRDVRHDLIFYAQSLLLGDTSEFNEMGTIWPDRQNDEISARVDGAVENIKKSGHPHPKRQKGIR